MTPKQRRVVVLLAEGCTQGIVADRLNVSRSFVSQTVSTLEKHSLLKKKSPSKYNAFYELSPQLKTQVIDSALPKLTTCRVHNIRRKYRVLYLSKPVSVDQRAGYMKRWEMRGGTRFKFWYSGKAGEPSVTVDVHPKTIVAYPDKGQNVIAETIAEAEDRQNMAVHNAVMKFVGMQAKFGVHMEIDDLGKPVGQTHYGFAMKKGSVHADGGTTLDQWEVDQSPQDLGHPDEVEFETRNKAMATPLDNAVKTIVAVPDAIRDFEKKLNPMNSSIQRVEAMLQGGVTISQQYEQMVNFMTKVMTEMEEMRAENAMLRKQLGGSA